MKQYNYDISTGVFLGAEEAFFDPLMNDNCLSANATFVEPPEVKEGHEAIFNVDTQSWSGVKILSDEEKIIEGILPLPSGYKIVKKKLVQMSSSELIAQLSAEERLEYYNQALEDLKIKAMHLRNGYELEGDAEALSKTQAFFIKEKTALQNLYNAKP